MKILLSAFVFIVTFPVITHAQADIQAEPPHGMSELEAYSIFVDAYRNGEYDLAIDYGEWMLEATPREIEGYENFSLERQFNRMAEVYVSKSEESGDPTQRTEYLEKAAEVFDLAFETFNEDEIDMFEWKLREGRLYHENHERMNADMNDAISAYKELYDMDMQRFVDEADGFYAQVLLLHYTSVGERERALEMIDEIEALASLELQNSIDEIRESLFETPEERIEFYESRLGDAEGDERIEILEALVELYEEVNEPEKAVESALELYEIGPNFINTRQLATIYLAEGNYNEALDFLKESFELAESNNDRKEISLEIAETYQQLEDFESARDYARQAIEIDDEWGPAYLRMATIYAGTISECTGGGTLAREDRAVYWLVLDYLDMATETDPSLASSAESRAESYRAAMPSSEDKFFRDWEEGDSFRIDGELDECYAWINETTTVR